MRRLSTRAAGLLILILGAWGGLVPFIGPAFHFALGPNHSWTWTSGRLWLSVIPGIVAVIGGLMLLGAGPRPSGKLGALLALAAGIWFAVGPEVSILWNSAGAAGVPHGSRFIRVLELLTYHTLLGVIIAALAGYALPGLETRRAAAEAEAEAGVGAAGVAGAGTAAVAERERERREPVAAAEREHEPVAATEREREPVAATEREREPVAATERERREPVAAAESEPVAADRDATQVTPARDETGARTAVMDRPGPAERAEAPAPATDGSADTGSADTGSANGGSTEPVTMRRRRGGLFSRLRS